MRYYEIFEGIPMGQKALTSPPKKNYTVGLEIEVYTEKNLEDDPDSYQEMYDRFSDSWTGWNQYSIRDFINDNVDFPKMIYQLDIEPKFGRPEVENVNDLQSLVSEEEFKKIRYILQKTREEDWEPDGDATFKELTNTQDTSRYYVSQVPNNIMKKFGFTGSWISGYTFKPNLWIYDDEKNPVTIEQVIGSLDDLQEYFDADMDEIEDYYSYEYHNSMSERISDDFNDYMNRNKGNLGSIEYVKEILRDNGFRKHDVVPDSTDYVSAEILTPPMPVDQAITNMHNIFELFDDNEIETNNSTGLHVNIGTWQEDYNDVDWLKFMVVFNSKKVLQTFGRSSNTFTEDKLQNIISSIEKSDSGLYKSSVSEMNSYVFDRLDKFSAVNFKKLFNDPSNRHIEIRSPGGQNYHEKGEQIEHVIRKAVRVLDIASDPTAYRQEYLKMLYKLMPEKSTKKYSPVDIFATKLDSYGGDIVEIIDRYISDNDTNVQPTEIDKATTADILRLLKSPVAKYYADFPRWVLVRSHLEKNNSPLLNAKIVKFLDSAAKRHFI